MEESSELHLSLQLENEENQQQQQQEISFDDRVKEITDITRYKFNDPNLLQQAFTHHSYEEDKCSSYQRLEYVGDAVLNMLIAKDHYFMYPDLDPGKLTRLRSTNVDTEKLARASLKHELYKYLRHKLPKLAGQIKEFKDAAKEYPLHSLGLIHAPKVLADIVESLIGAIFIDSNLSFDTTLKLVKNLLQPVISPGNLHIHPVTMLYELCQKNGLTIKIEDLWEESGEIEFVLDGESVGRAKYSGKRYVAYNRAAHIAYHQILTKLEL